MKTKHMKTKHPEMDFAIEVFVRGHSAGKSHTFPYEASRVGPVWVMRDAPRKNPRAYRKEEWIAHVVDAREVDAIARRHTRGLDRIEIWAKQVHARAPGSR